ncbi:MAG: electron transfer flavoprotein subunit beta/FixA family protein [Thermoplasmata archaeon]
MDIVVCIKQVPEITEVKIDPVTNTLVREGVPSIVNPFDEFALEEAIRIKEKSGGTVTVVTMGPPQAKEALLRCLAMGADKAMHLTDRMFAGSDTLATAYTLALAIRKLKFDLIFCGKQAIDGDTAQVAASLAEKLGIPQITYIKKVDVDEKNRKIVVHRETDEGYEVIECRFPVLLTAIKGLNEPRLPSVMGIISAKKKEIKTLGAADIATTAESEKFGLKGSPTYVEKIFAPTPPSSGLMFTGDESSSVKKLIQHMISDKVL